MSELHSSNGVTASTTLENSSAKEVHNLSIVPQNARYLNSSENQSTKTCVEGNYEVGSSTSNIKTEIANSPSTSNNNAIVGGLLSLASSASQTTDSLPFDSQKAQDPVKDCTVSKTQNVVISSQVNSISSDGKPQNGVNKKDVDSNLNSSLNAKGSFTSDSNGESKSKPNGNADYVEAGNNGSSLHHQNHKITVNFKHEAQAHDESSGQPTQSPNASERYYPSIHTPDSRFNSHHYPGSNHPMMSPPMRNHTGSMASPPFYHAQSGQSPAPPSGYHPSQQHYQYPSYPTHPTYSYSCAPHQPSPYAHSSPYSQHQGSPPYYGQVNDTREPQYSNHTHIKHIQYQGVRHSPIPTSSNRPTGINSDMKAPMSSNQLSSSQEHTGQSQASNQENRQSQSMLSSDTNAPSAIAMDVPSSVPTVPPMETIDNTKNGPQKTVCYDTLSKPMSAQNKNEITPDTEHPNKKRKLITSVVSNPNTPISNKGVHPTHNQQHQVHHHPNIDSSDRRGSYYQDPSNQVYHGRHYHQQPPPPPPGEAPHSSHFYSPSAPIYPSGSGPQAHGVYPQHSSSTPVPPRAPYAYHPYQENMSPNGPQDHHHAPPHVPPNGAYSHWPNSYTSYNNHPNHNHFNADPVMQSSNSNNPMLVTPTQHSNRSHVHPPPSYTSPMAPPSNHGRIYDSHVPVHNYSKSPSPQSSSHPPHPQASEINSVAQWQQAQMLTGFAPSANKCVPLKSPIPSKFWGDVEKTKDAYIPDFHRLVNFPDYLPKNRPTAGDGMRCCVMCGKPRLCPSPSSKNSSNSIKNGSNDANLSGGSNNIDNTKKDDTSSASENGKKIDAPTIKSKVFHRGDGGPVHIIPRQNKGLCTVCDVTVWVVTVSGLEIKWCKGCKNFRPWAAFGDKGLATKCVRCRDRQREKYAMQKEDLKQKRRLTSSTLATETGLSSVNTLQTPSVKKENESSQEEKKSDAIVIEEKSHSSAGTKSGLIRLIAATNKIEV